MPGPWQPIAHASSGELTEDLALVLESAGIASDRFRDGDRHVLLVRPEDAERARAEIAKYDVENRGWPSPPPAAPAHAIAQGRDAAIVYGVLLLAAFLAQHTVLFDRDWSAAGWADAGLIREGAWWRSVTALTLHADALHVAGNVVFGALFGVMLAQSIGFGWAWLCFVVTGGLANAANAWIQSPSHVSIGASTGVFGLLGAQVAYEWVRRRQLRHGPLRRWAPLIMGLALLAWLGGSGAEDRLGDLDVITRKVDVGAHVAGFAVGVLLGAGLGWSARRLPASFGAQLALAGAACGLVVLAWILAMTGNG